MFRVLWRFPFYGSGVASVVTAFVAESWAWPVTVQLPPSSNTILRDPLDLVEMGHKEVTQ